ncbi:hypothetical protein NQZ68_010627 [Dissostichus eleginoides]|nr:hypothetical protein NQZ68_010627 [Dissostichus eleginoides]
MGGSHAETLSILTELELAEEQLHSLLCRQEDATFILRAGVAQQREQHTPSGSRVYLRCHDTLFDVSRDDNHNVYLSLKSCQDFGLTP